jgi:putative ABC transport system permease protein
MLIFKNLWRQRSRFFLTILAVVWSTFSITIMLSVGEGLRLTFGRVIANTGSAVLIVANGETTEAYHGVGAGMKLHLTDQDLLLLKNALKDKASITGDAKWDVKIFYNDKRSGGSVIPVSLNYHKLHGIQIAQGGRFINSEDERLHRQVIVLGSHSVEKLFLPHVNPVGKYVYLQKKPFLVVGQQEETMQLIDYNNGPDNYLNWIPYSTYQTLTATHVFNNFLIAPYNLSDSTYVENLTRKLFSLQHKINPADLGTLTFTNLQTKKEKINLFFYGIEIILGLIGTLTLLVAAIGIANVMFISVKSSTREIGLRMALGAKTWEIMRDYASEAIIATGIGGFLGVGAAWLVIKFLNQIHINSQVFAHLGNPRPHLSLSLVGIIVILLCIVSLVAGIFPARKAAYINPALALKHEK